MAEHLPRVKLIALLRDPVGRAYSHYQHEVARGFETLSFEEAIEAEPARLAGETERMLAEPLYNSFAHQHHSYLARGRYHEQLERWRARFDDRQLLVLSSERFFAEPGADVQAGARLPRAAGVHPRRLREAQRLRLPEDGRRGPRRGWSSTTGSPTGGCTSRSATTSAGAPSPLMETAAAPATGDDAARRDLTTLARGGALNLVGAAATGLCNFVLLVVVARGLRAQGTGAFYEAVALFLILSSAATLGADVGLSRMVPRYRALGRVRDLRRGLHASLWPVAAAGLLLGGLAYGFAPELADVFSRHGEDRPADRLHPHLRGVRPRLGAVADGVRGHPGLRHHAADGVPGQDRPPGPPAPARAAGHRRRGRQQP